MLLLVQDSRGKMGQPLFFVHFASVGRQHDRSGAALEDLPNRVCAASGVGNGLRYEESKLPEIEARQDSQLRPPGTTSS